MNDLGPLAKMLIVMGLFLVALGGALLLASKLPYLGLGRLPGDIYVKRGNFTFYFPIVTCIILSVVLTLLLNLFFRR
ncbi:MAG: DUF2905 domain-containing protein [Aquificota bacterium]|uniref:DUF2905 domain-containing protein n=1 Tax=Thermosulfidibacter takaii TaxID=412593 RepID=A0A7C0YD31_9BACT|nr:MAG: DUF2905 domain-containing protein [Aquificota bacterium]RLD99568.1 MAG: DUF2905 domain-containing protein [Aquificota bacterium]HDD52999.1 DUF2905 domain-containing protein [Thermosulfidibacter takaii]